MSLCGRATVEPRAILFYAITAAAQRRQRIKLVKTRASFSGSGTPLFYRRLQVGEVGAYALDPDGKSFTVKVFVQAPYDQYVTPATRFWHASGLDVSMSATGFSVESQSLLSILVGGIAFDRHGHLGKISVGCRWNVQRQRLRRVPPRWRRACGGR